MRRATRDGHRCLDHHPLLTPLVAPASSRGHYARALAALHGPQAALEARLADFAPQADFPPRLPDLVADLADLGVSAFPLCAEPPDAPSPAALIGLMYVLEGSNLGGSVIARCLASSHPQAPRRFFDGADATNRWQRFWALAATWCPPTQADLAIDAAGATFIWYRRHLDGCLDVCGTHGNPRGM